MENFFLKVLLFVIFALYFLTFIGTPNYMSPEVIVDLQYHYASDIWSSACFLLHMLTGKVPWTKTYPGLGDYRYVIGDR